MPKSTDLRGAILKGAGRLPASDAVAGASGPASARPFAGARQASRVGKVSICGHFAPEVRRQLRRLAVDTDRTVQDLMGEALNDLFAKHGLPELVEGDVAAA